MSSSGSVCETDLSSLSSSCKSNINEETNSPSQDESTVVLISLIDKLKRELATVKQAKSQLATLYKVSEVDKLLFCLGFFEK